ncbi:pathogenesis-related thaumatin superfamily protein [Striga asiatica]|uniref:Pathogenesis-related thaumatin superfamily protein n=1 Tax=Striga asiatica TaxID=4170 RepID=A0A5A7NZ90_STRAF|nr:pathogenesis-related thaumatin superfamily protein [Striga asiatica]
MSGISSRLCSSALLPILLLCALADAAHHHPNSSALTFTLVNNCPFTVWPAIQQNAGHPPLERGGGFALPTLHHHSFAVPSVHWSGRIWARTGCSHSGGRFSCATGDCAGLLECAGHGGAAPATLAQFSLHHGGAADLSSYGVSLVDGFNVPMTVTPHEGKGLCPVVGCRADLLATCPAPLQVRAATAAAVVGCKSGCAAFGTDELCCRGHYNSPQTCRASSYSTFFKHACPHTFTYAHDSPTLMHECSAPRELKVIFCH